MLSAKVWVKRKPEQRVDTSFSTLTESLTTLVLFVANVSGWRAVQPGSIYVKPSHWDLCLCLVPFQFFFLWWGPCWQSRGFQVSWWKAAPSNTITKSNRAWILPLFMTPGTHFHLVTHLLHFLCDSDYYSLFPCHLISMSLDLLPHPACFLACLHAC